MLSDRIIKREQFRTFHEYVYDLRFVVKNDHKPLISIFSEGTEQITTTNTTFPATITTLQLPTPLCLWKSTIRCGHTQQVTVARQHIQDQK